MFRLTNYKGDVSYYIKDNWYLGNKQPIVCIDGIYRQGQELEQWIDSLYTLYN